MQERPNTLVLHAVADRSGRPLEAFHAWWSDGTTTVHRIANPETGLAIFHGVPSGALTCCVGGRARKADAQAVARVPASGSTRVELRVKPKVLVTGFCDWDTDHNDLGKSTWKCTMNPSGRLLLGRWTDDATQPPLDHLKTNGPLTKLLLLHTSYTWDFKLLLVQWGAGKTIPWKDHDVVVSLGLDANETNKIFKLEQGAYNQRGDNGTPIEPGKPSQVDAPSTTAAVLQKMSGRSHGGYDAVATAARPANNFICNEANYAGIQAKLAGHSRPRATMFVHIPWAPGQQPNESNKGDLVTLAAALDSLISDFLCELESAALLGSP